MQTPIRVGDCVRKDQKDKRVVSFNKGITSLIAFDDNTGVVGVNCLNKFECLETPSSSYGLIINDNPEQTELISKHIENLKTFRKFHRVDSGNSASTSLLNTLKNEVQKPKSLNYLLFNSTKVNASNQNFIKKDKIKEIVSQMHESSRLFIIMNCKNSQGFVNESDCDASKKCAIMLPNRKDLDIHQNFGLFGTRFLQWVNKQFDDSKCGTSRNTIQMALAEIGIGKEKDDITASPAVIAGDSSVMDCVFL